MTRSAPLVTALVDRSAYAGSVAEHGAWLAGRLGARLQLRHAREPDESVPYSRRLLEELSSRIVDQGAPEPDLSLVEGGVLAAAVRAEAGLLVMGKRGVGAGDDRETLGGHVDPVVRAATVPVCLVAQVFLPVHRVLTVTDANPERRAALDLMASHAQPDVELDVVVVSRAGDDPEEKLDLARRALRGAPTRSPSMPSGWAKPYGATCATARPI